MRVKIRSWSALTKEGPVYTPKQLFADRTGEPRVSHLLKGLLQLEMLTVKNTERKKNIVPHGRGRSLNKTEKQHHCDGFNQEE